MKTLTWDEFVSNVQTWATERGIYEHSTAEAQLLKALSELGELADAVIKNDRDGLADAIGDVSVCWVNYATKEGLNIIYTHGAPALFKTDQESIGLLSIEFGDLLTGIYCDASGNVPMMTLENIAVRNGLDFLECCTKAWNEIKDRKGRMVAGGAFVKDE